MWIGAAGVRWWGGTDLSAVRFGYGVLVRRELGNARQVAGDAVAVGEHIAEGEFDGPGEEGVEEGAAGELEVDVVGEAGAGAGGGEFVAVDPAGEGAGDLFVDEEAVGFVVGVAGEPAEGADAEFEFGTGVDAVAGAGEEADGRERRREEREGVRAFVEGEDGFDRGVDEGGFRETGHLWDEMLSGRRGLDSMAGNRGGPGR